jgi:hypothetical protein
MQIEHEPMIYEAQILTWALIKRRVYDLKGVTYDSTLQVGYKGKTFFSRPPPTHTPLPKKRKNVIVFHMKQCCFETYSCFCLIE